MKHTKILIGIVLILVISIPAFLYFIYTDKPLTKNTSSTINIENKETDTNDSNNNSNSNNSKVNINTGGVEELKALPGVGDLLAQKIIDYREENGKFKTIDELKNVSGIGDKKFESMKEYVSVK